MRTFAPGRNVRRDRVSIDTAPALLVRREGPDEGQAMRDTTRWRKDADRLRRHLFKVYRLGDIDAIARATQELEVLLRRADRPACSGFRAVSEDRSEATPAQQTGGCIRHE